MNQRPFYIGWMDRAPDAYARFTRNYLLVVLAVVLLFGAGIVLAQKKSGTGIFEFGQLTTVRGTYFSRPFPLIRTSNGRDIFGNQDFLSIPLVGYGKHGAIGVMSELEKMKHVELEGRTISMKGTLLYNDGKTMLQVDAADSPLSAVSPAPEENSRLPVGKELGTMVVRGEIIDPKCFFGVMKPGEGKPHRDCAVRCILGGMPPMFLVRDKNGVANHYLLVGPDGEPVNERIAGVVGEPLAITARLVQQDDWIVMYLPDHTLPQPLSYLQARFGAGIISCGKGATH